VGNISHEPGIVSFCGLFERGIVPIPRIRGCATNYESRLEDIRLLLKAFVVDVLSSGIETIRKRLEVDGRS